MIKAFRDTWELGIHSYLTYLRDRLLLAKELLHESGSVFVQISDENVHHVREIMDEVFGPNNFISLITFVKTTSSTSTSLSGVYDIIVWYSKVKSTNKYRQLFLPKKRGGDGASAYKSVILNNQEIKPASEFENSEGELNLPTGSVLVSTDNITSQSPGSRYDVNFKGKIYRPEPGYWKTDEPRMQRLLEQKRITATENKLAYIRHFNDFPVYPISNIWTDTLGQNQFGGSKIYAVQTALSVVKRCILMSTDPGDLVLDVTCGSGTTANVAEQWGRRWITCDTSRVAIALAKQRFMTSPFDYYQLAQPDEGIGSGLKYKTVPHITLKSIANNEPPGEETLYDQPLIDTKKSRVTGPFTVEAVPAPVVKALDEIDSQQNVDDESITRSGETLRQNEWREELLRTGVRAKGGSIMEFSRVELMAGTRYLHAEAEQKVEPPKKNLFEKEDPTIFDLPKKVIISFGPEHAPLEQRQVEEAWQEARPFKPDILLFCAFQFDNEAAKDIDEMNPQTAGMQFLKAQMNADMLTDDLKKKRSSNESFWLIGQPDVQVKEISEGDDKGKIQVEVLGFDYYNPKTGTVDSGGKKNIAMWMLDTDYDNRSMFPSQVFFPISGAKDGWSKLAKNLKAEIDEEKIEAFRGTVSLPFSRPESKQIAVKIIDDRGIESLRVITL